jgi:NitT/TauT family transport system permease protein
MPKWPKISGSLKRLLIWIIFLAIWEMAFRIFAWRFWLFPAPSTILRSFIDMLSLSAAFGGRPLIQAPLVSILRLLTGFSISIALGAFLGLTMWRWQELDKFLGPLFLGLQTLPSVCWVPLAILIFGINEYGIHFVLVMGSFFAIAIALRDGLATIPPIYRRAGLMLGATGWKLYCYVLLPASLPALATSLRQGFSFAWRSLMGAELMFTVQKHGLGFLLDTGRNFADVAQVVSVMIVMVLIGMTADRLAFAKLQHRVQTRFGLT